MLWTIIGILLLIWMISFLFELAGGIIHILLIIALIVFIVKMLRS
ncbi:lmo0937 family membrane protein [Gracilibacillus sp. YIM 98692]|nr:lmo0937 family membrane protein [Gracilibacillus sp. YIM 98692]